MYDPTPMDGTSPDARFDVGSTEPRHLYEEVFYVLDGTGSTVLELGGVAKRSFEWGRGSLFAMPVNARYRHHNASGTTRARITTVTTPAAVIEGTYRTKSEFQIDHDEEDPSIRTLFEAERARFLASREKATAVRS